MHCSSTRDEHGVLALYQFEYESFRDYIYIVCLGCCGHIWTECHRSAVLFYDCAGAAVLCPVPTERTAQNTGFHRPGQGDDPYSGDAEETCG